MVDDRQQGVGLMGGVLLNVGLDEGLTVGVN